MRLYQILYSLWRFWAGSERPFAVGFVSQNSDICRIPFKPVPKDAGAAPASFEPLCRCARQIAEFRDTNPTANGLSNPAKTHRPQRLHLPADRPQALPAGSVCLARVPCPPCIALCCAVQLVVHLVASIQPNVDKSPRYVPHLITLEADS